LLTGSPHEQKFATAIGWTNNATRVLERTDLSYLTAFGNSIMAEVLNQQATALSAASHSGSLTPAVG